MKKKNKREEDRFQMICVDWFKLQYPRKILYHIVNSLQFVAGSDRGSFIGALKRLVRMGLKKGMPDLCIAEPRGPYCGLYIEMKTLENDAEEHQIDIHLRLRRNRYAVYICKEFDQFRLIVNGYFLLDKWEESSFVASPKKPEGGR